MLPSRLAASASSTMPPTSAFTPASWAESVKRVFPRRTVIGFSSGSWSSRRTTRRASPVVMPPTSTPATVTPSAIRSSRELSYANAATAPPIRTRRRTATRMNHRCLMGGYRAQGSYRRGGLERLGTGLRTGTASLRTGHRLVLAQLHPRIAPRQHGVDGAQHPGPIGVIALILAQRLKVLVLERGEQRDDLLSGEIVVVVDRGARRRPLGLRSGTLVGLREGSLSVRASLRLRVGAGPRLGRTGALLGGLLGAHRAFCRRARAL